MQLFEVIEQTEFPFMETKEVVEGITIGDIINNSSNEKVFLLVDHDTRNIWTFNGPQSSLKIQVYGGILAGMLRLQLKMFYRVYLLNMYSKNDTKFQEIMQKRIGTGRAKQIEKEDVIKYIEEKDAKATSIQNPNLKKAFEYIDQFPKPENLIRRFMIVGGQIFTDEETTEAFVKEEKSIIRTIKLGRLNNGFTLFKDHNYTTRLIIKERMIQGIELYIHKDEKSPSLELQIPIIHEEKFSKPGSLEALIDAFQIQDQLPKEEEEEEKEV